MTNHNTRADDYLGFIFGEADQRYGYQKETRVGAERYGGSTDCMGIALANRYAMRCSWLSPDK